MKVQLVNTEKGEFKVITESYSEFVKYHLLSLGAKSAAQSIDTSDLSEIKPKRHYKKQYVKTCEVCGKKFKGNIGVALHRARAHEGRNWNKNGTPKVAPISNFIPVKAAV